jgi:hypothetical protein
LSSSCGFPVWVSLLHASKKTEESLFSRILFPLDFSRPANEALKAVGRIGGVYEIILLHVVRKIEEEGRMNLVVREVEKRLSDAQEKI